MDSGLGKCWPDADVDGHSVGRKWPQKGMAHGLPVLAEGSQPSVVHAAAKQMCICSQRLSYAVFNPMRSLGLATGPLGRKQKVFIDYIQCPRKVIVMMPPPATELAEDQVLQTLTIPCWPVKPNFCNSAAWLWIRWQPPVACFGCS